MNGTKPYSRPVLATLLRLFATEQHRRRKQHSERRSALSQCFPWHSQKTVPGLRACAFSGVALSGIAIIFDRAGQAFGGRLQTHSEVVHG
ncbi:hypothetical protein A8M32_10185 [Sinorhizobium alkalisoli]|uniref:Uncharacterized protein n=1 Tax=Sinorhizobium alkalisoli TaxID=1752398 RepID=A0A1E3VDH3_9HYPH|nr:hypothetical protein A8M32_10185 [Sinorhizobium alkalisoli]